jgi:hypothetical protein
MAEKLPYGYKQTYASFLGCIHINFDKITAIFLASCSDILNKIHIHIFDTISISLDSLSEESLQDLVNHDTGLFVVSKQSAAYFEEITLRFLENIVIFISY